MDLRVAVLDPGNFAPFYCNGLCASLAGRLEYTALVTSHYPWEDYPFASNFDLRYHFYRLGSRLKAPLLRTVTKTFEHTWDWARLLVWIRRQKINIVHLQWAMLPLIDYWAIAALKHMGIPVIYTAHDLLPKLNYTGAVFLRRAFYRVLDHTVVYTESNAEELTGLLRVKPSKVAVIPPGPLVEKDALKLTKAEARQSLGLDESSLVLLFFGGVQRYKGLEILLEAFGRLHALLPKTQLVVAGRARYRLPASTFTQAGVFTDLRYLPEAVALAYFQSADLVVLPYRAAATSAVLLTALALGQPVVVSDVGALGDTVRQTDAGLVVPPSDPEALFTALHGLLSDRRRLKEYESRAARWRENAPSWGEIATRTIQLYESALARR